MSDKIIQGRLLVKTSVTTDTPLPTDLISRELAFSFSSGGLFIKYPDNSVRRINLNGSGEWGNVVGDINTQTDLMGKFNSKQDLLNQGGGIVIQGNSISVDYNGIVNKPTLGDSAALNVGITDGTVAAGNHTHTKSSVGLDQVDNTSDLNKPISNAVQAALNGKQDVLTPGLNITILDGVISASGGGGSSSIITWDAVQNKPITFPPSTHYHAKADVGLDQVDNTSDLNKPISTATQSALNAKVNLSDIGSANGVAGLDSNSKVPMVNIPSALAGAFNYQGQWDANVNFPQLTNAMALTKGLCYKVSNTGSTFLSGISDWSIGDYVVSNGTSWDRWKGVSDVNSVAGRKGSVTLVKADVGLGNVDNTSDLNKPISTATQSALNAKVNLSDIGSANGVAGLDSNSKVPVTQIPTTIASALSYVGDWNASNNTPTIPTASSSNKGNFYIVTTPGATSIGGINTWNVTDWIISTGTSWIRAEVKNLVTSVANKTGAITLGISDITGLQTALSSAGQVTSVATRTGDITLGISDITGLQVALNAAGASGSVQSVAGKTGVVTLAKADVGLDQVDNTSDLNKPISTATQSALDSKASTAIATSSTNGILSASDKTKLDTVSTGATSNQTDAYLLNRANHTGTQVTSTIIGLDAALASKEASANKGIANGYAGLDSNAKIATVNLPDSVVGALNYIAVWDASTNTPTIPSASSSNKGNYYKVSIAGSTSINGISNWTVGDWIVSNGNGWERIHTQETIASVNNMTGAVVLTKNNIGLDQVDNTSDLNKPISTATQSALDGKASTATVTTSVNGLMLATDKVKLDGISTGATANSPDLYLLNRTNHTGTQAINTITGLQSSLDGKLSSSSFSSFGLTLGNSGDQAAARASLGLGSASLQDVTYFALTSHTHTKSQVGLDQVDNTSDLNKPISTAVQTALNGKELTSNKGAANGYAGLDSNGQLPIANAPGSLVSNVNSLTTSVNTLTTTVNNLSIASTAPPDVYLVDYNTRIDGNSLSNKNSTSTLSVTNFSLYGTTYDTSNSVSISPLGEIIVGDVNIDAEISIINKFQTLTTYPAGTEISISGCGIFSMKSNGDYYFVPTEGFKGSAPDISYTVFDGTNSKTYTLIFLVQSNISTLGDAASLNVGTTTGTVAAGDDSRILSSLQVKGTSTDGPPAIGTFSLFDVYRDSSPLTSGFMYWQCIFAGINSAAVWSGLGNVTLQLIDSAYTPPTNIADTATYIKTYTINKASIGDRVILAFNTSYDMTDISIVGDVTTSDTVTITLTNNTGATVSITPGTMLIRVMK